MRVKVYRVVPVCCVLCGYVHVPVARASERSCKKPICVRSVVVGRKDG